MPKSVQVQIEDAIVALLKGMSFAWPSADMIRAARLPWNVQGDGTVVIHPGISVYSVPSTEAPGTNIREDIGYGVGMAVIRPADHWTVDSRDTVPGVIEAVRRKLIHDRLTVTLSGGNFCQIKIGHLDLNAPKEAHRYELSGLLFRCWMRESRT